MIYIIFITKNFISIKMRDLQIVIEDEDQPVGEATYLPNLSNSGYRSNNRMTMERYSPARHDI